ncbi:Hypothetical protein EHI5A_135130, partial [Entamoeba histolytica KU27]
KFLRFFFFFFFPTLFSSFSINYLLRIFSYFLSFFHLFLSSFY